MEKKHEKYFFILNPSIASNRIDFLPRNTTTLRSHYKNLLSQASFKHFAPMLPKFIEKLESEKRFAAELELQISVHDAIFATVSHPRFKLGWLGSDTVQKRTVRDLFEAEVAKVIEAEIPPEQKSNANTSTVVQTSRNHNSIVGIDGAGMDDFLIMHDESENAGYNRATNEVSAYLNNLRHDFAMLDLYPTVRKIFKRTNTVMCSSAPLERTFNYAGILDNPKRGSIAPGTFTNSVIIKGNQAFESGEQPKRKASTTSTNHL